MKMTGHGHMRLMALLKELVRDKGYKSAARVLELDQRTVAESAKTGQLSRRVRQALERALQEGVGSAAARQRERNEKLENRVEALEKGHEALAKGYDALGKEVRRRVAAVEGRVEALRRDGEQGTGAGHAGAGPSQAEADGSERGASGMDRKPPPRPRLRREVPRPRYPGARRGRRGGVRRCVADDRRVAGAEGRSPQRGEGDRRQLLLPVLLPHRRMLPNFRRFSIDAHRSDITQSHLIDLPVFG